MDKQRITEEYPVESLKRVSQDHQPDPVLGIARSVRQSARVRQRVTGPKTFFIVLAQGILMLVLYSWIIQEYQANANMQVWLGPNVLIGNLLLTNTGLFVVSAVVALLVFESIPGKTLSR
jgi:hypothetical protein